MHPEKYLTGPLQQNQIRSTGLTQFAASPADVFRVKVDVGLVALVGFGLAVVIGVWALVAHICNCARILIAMRVHKF